MIDIDGSEGEGGGQVLRTSLALSIVTGKPFRIFNIRARRKNPGLQRQHLAAVKAAREICGGGVQGAEPGSKILVFGPGPVRAGDYAFDVGSAGSASLVLQTILPPLLLASGTSRVSIGGGTHNPMAPPFDFLARAFLPVLRLMGADAAVSVDRHGFYPAGGGRLAAQIRPWANPGRLSLTSRPQPVWWTNALLCRLENHIGVREIGVARAALEIPRQRAVLRRVDADCPGNVIMIYADCGTHMEVFTSIGQRGVSAERVAQQVVDQALAWQQTGAPVGEHLADQLLVPMALGAGGSFVTGPVSGHTQTNIATIRRFVDAKIEVERLDGQRNRISVNS